MDALRTPLVGIAFAFFVLLIEGFAGSALMTDAEAKHAMREQQAVDQLIEHLDSRDEATRCCMCVPRACLENPLAKGC